ncbi:MAG: PAS domain S-box protein, partial [bacterium]|nr:PAS domain S-box protein [bacterium]
MTTANLKMITLLLVSNENSHQQILQDIFETHVENLHIAKSPRQALEIFKNEHPEVVVIDSTLQGFTHGFYVELRQLCGADGVILSLVEHDTSPEMSISLSASVDDCFTFSTPPELMRRRLKNLLLMKHQSVFQRMTGTNLPTNDAQLAEEKYRHLFDSANDAIFIVDMATGRFLDVNRRAVRWLGYQRDQLLQMTHFDIEAPLISQNGEESKAVVQQLSTNGHFIFEVGYKAQDGTIFPTEVSSRIFTYDGRRALLNIVRDITRQKQIKAAEDAQRQLAEALRDTAAALNSTLEMNEVIKRVLQSVTQVLPSQMASIMLIEGKYARMMEFVGYEGVVKDLSYLDGLRVEIESTSNMAWMIEHRKPHVIADIQQYPTWVTLTESSWIRSYIGAPIIAEDKVIGFLNMDYPEPNRFTQAHADQLMAFANQAGIAIQNARLHEAIRRYADELEKRVQERTLQLTLVNNQLLEQITERQKIETQLDEERTLLRALIDNIPDEIYVKDIHGRHILVNKAMHKRLSSRAPNGVVIGTTNADYLPEEKVIQRKQEEHHIIYERKAALTQEGSFQWDTPEPTWVLMTRAPIYDSQGQPLGLVGINRDITEVKNAEEYVSYIIGGAYCLLWYSIVEDIGGKFKWSMQVSNEEASMRFLPLKLEPTQTYMDAFRRSVFPDDIPQLHANSSQAIRDGKTNYYQEYRCTRADGEIRWLHEEAQITPLGGGRYRIVGVCTDITERKLAEETLQLANELLEDEVKNRTKDLIEINKDLIRQVQVREQAE